MPRIEIDTRQGVIWVDGTKIALEMFAFFDRSAELGTVFRFVHQLEDGAVVLESLTLAQPTGHLLSLDQ